MPPKTMKPAKSLEDPAPAPKKTHEQRLAEVYEAAVTGIPRPFSPKRPYGAGKKSKKPKKKGGILQDTNSIYWDIYEKMADFFAQQDGVGATTANVTTWWNMSRDDIDSFRLWVDNTRAEDPTILEVPNALPPPTPRPIPAAAGAGKKPKKPKKKVKMTKSESVAILREVNKIIKGLKRKRVVTRKPKELKQIDKDLAETQESKETIMKELSILPRKPDIRDPRLSMPIFPRANILEGQPSLPVGVAEDIKELKKKAEEEPVRRRELKEQITDKHKLFEDILKGISVEIKNQQLKTADLDKLIKEAGLSDADAIKMAQQIEERHQPQPLLLEQEVKDDIEAGIIDLVDLEARYKAQNLGPKFPTVTDLRDEKTGWREYFERTHANYPSMTKEDFIRNWLVGKDVLNKLIDEMVGVPKVVVEEVEVAMPPPPGEPAFEEMEEEPPKEKKKKKKKKLPQIEDEWLADKSSHSVRRYKALVAKAGFPEAAGLVKWYKAKLAIKEAALATATGAAKKSLQVGIKRDKELIAENEALLD